METQKLLQQAVQLSRMGELDLARKVFQRIIKDDPNCIAAIWGMANLTTSPKRRFYLLKRLLEIQPDHQGARKMMKGLSANGVSVARNPNREYLLQTEAPTEPITPISLLTPATSACDHITSNDTRPNSSQASEPKHIAEIITPSVSYPSTPQTKQPLASTKSEPSFLKPEPPVRQQLPSLAYNRQKPSSSAVSVFVGLAVMSSALPIAGVAIEQITYSAYSQDALFRILGQINLFAALVHIVVGFQVLRRISKGYKNSIKIMRSGIAYGIISSVVLGANDSTMQLLVVWVVWFIVCMALLRLNREHLREFELDLSSPYASPNHRPSNNFGRVPAFVSQEPGFLAGNRSLSGYPLHFQLNRRGLLDSSLHIQVSDQNGQTVLLASQEKKMIQCYSDEYQKKLLFRIQIFGALRGAKFAVSTNDSGTIGSIQIKHGLRKSCIIRDRSGIEIAEIHSEISRISSVLKMYGFYGDVCYVLYVKPGPIPIMRLNVEGNKWGSTLIPNNTSPQNAYLFLAAFIAMIRVDFPNNSLSSL